MKKKKKEKTGYASYAIKKTKVFFYVKNLISIITISSTESY